MVMNNNEQKSILEVFGEKSQDGDKVKGLLLNALMRNSYQEGGEVEEKSGLFGNIVGMFKDFGTKRKIKKSGKEYNRLGEEYRIADNNLSGFLDQMGVIKVEDNNVTFDNVRLKELSKNEHFTEIYSKLLNEQSDTKGRMEQGRGDYEALQKLLENN